MASVPGFVAPPPPAKKVSFAPNAVMQRLLALPQAKAGGYQSFALWTNLASRYRVPAPELLAAALATRTPPNRVAVDRLARSIRDGVSRSGSLEAFLGQTYQGADSVTGIYAAAKATRYVPDYGLTPAQKAGATVEQGAATTALRGSVLKWVTYDPKTGKIGTTNITATDPISGLPAKPPKNGLFYGQTPVTNQVFAQALSDLSDHFAAYAPDTPHGVNLKDPRYAAQVADFLYKGLSPTAIDNALAAQPGFQKSRAWKAAAPAIIAQGKALYGEAWKPDRSLVRNAIVQNWSQGTLVANLKARPEYLRGPQYRQQTAALNNVHMSIMGTPNVQDEINVHEAALEGWSPDQYAAWIRSTDAYRYSPEAKAYSIGIAEQLGLITGRQGIVPASAPGGAPQPQDSTAIPNSQRIPGAPTGSATPNLPAPKKPPYTAVGAGGPRYT